MNAAARFALVLIVPAAPGCRSVAAHCGEEQLLVARALARTSSTGRFVGCVGLATAGPQPTPLQLDGAVAVLEKRAVNASARIEWAVGLAAVDQIDRAIVVLDEVVAEAPSAAAWTDLAALHLRKSPGTASIHSIAALNAAARARAAEPYDAAAVANEVEAIARIHLRDSETTPTPLSPPAAARHLVERTLLLDWSRAMARRDVGAARLAMDRLAVAGETVAHMTGDRLVADVAHQLRASGVAAAEGAAAFARGGELLEHDREADAAQAFGSAAAALKMRAPALAGWARASELHAAFGRYDAVHLDQAGHEAAALAAWAGAREYRALEGRALYLQGAMHGALARLTLAEELYDRSVAVLVRADDPELRAATHVLRSNVLANLGLRDESWQADLEAIRLLPAVASARRRYAVLLHAAIRAAGDGFEYAALHFLDAADAEARRSGGGGRHAEVLLHRAQIRQRLGDAAGASADLRDAEAALDAALDSLVRERLQAELFITRAIVQQSARASASALEYFERRGFGARLASLHLWRGRQAAAQGDPAAAAHDLAAGIGAYEAYRRSLTSVQRRVTSLDVMWDLFGEAIRLDAGRNDYPAMFADAERARGRALVDERRQVAPNLSDVQHRLPAGSWLLYYVLLDDRLFVFVAGNQQYTVVHRDVTRSELRSRVARFLTVLEQGGADADQRSLSERLYDDLIAPAEPLIGEARTLVIAPDSFLSLVPFAALRNRGTGRYVVDDHATVIVPSVTSLQESGGDRGRAPNALAVAVSGAAATPFLPDAEAEAADVARQYASATVLAGTQATPTAFLASAVQHDVVHFAGHAFAADTTPLAGRLQLSPEAGRADGGTLYADEIWKTRFTRTRLVVLAACRTGFGPVFRGEGTLDLAHPFLAAGVPTVVGALWDVRDTAAHSILVGFHRAYAAGRPAHEALRQAQLAALHESSPELRSPSGWAAFTTFTTTIR